MKKSSMRIPLEEERGDRSCEDCTSSALSVRILSGSIGSVLTSLVVTPLEVVKVRLQASAAEAALPLNVAKCAQGCGTFVLTNFAGQTQLLPRNRVPFFDCRTGQLTELARQSCSGSNGVLKALRNIYMKEGLAGVYAGLTPTLVMAVPNTVVYFSAYEEFAFRLRAVAAGPNESTPALVWWAPLVAGGSARLLASSVTAPFEYMRTREALMEGRNQSHQSLWREMASTIQKEGVRALYKGFFPTLWRDVPFSAIYWMALERMRESWRQNGYAHVSPAHQASQAFVNGLVAGIVAAACTTPFDVVKTRQQQQVNAFVLEGVKESSGLLCNHGGAVAIEPYPSSPGTMAHLRHIAATEGVVGLWRGNWTRMLKVAPACAMMISSYEFGKRMLQ